MIRRGVATLLAGVVTLAVGLACGDVPTLPGGVAYISPILPPSPSVTFGDTLRDSLGHAAPLRVVAIGRSSGDTIRPITVRYLLTSLNTGATVGGDGFLVAPESLSTLRLVAQVIDAGGVPLQLQTAELSIDVVPLADSIAPTSAPDTTKHSLVPLSVTVSGIGPKQVRGPVGGIRVGYRVVRTFPDNARPARWYYLTDDASNVLRPDSTIAIDTTTANGVASRTFIGLLAPPGESNADSVIVEARASSQRGVPLRGSPVSFMIRIH